MPPAARISDMHTCPMVTPGTPPIPHVGGPISMGFPTVMIGFMPAARMGDMAVCVGPPDSIAKGSMTVFIGNMQAARIGDLTMHGGTIAMGCPTVMIGDVGMGCGGAGGAIGGALAGAAAGTAPKAAIPIILAGLLGLGALLAIVLLNKPRPLSQKQKDAKIKAIVDHLKKQGSQIGKDTASRIDSGQVKVHDKLDYPGKWPSGAVAVCVGKDIYVDLREKPSRVDVDVVHEANHAVNDGFNSYSTAKEKFEEEIRAYTAEYRYQHNGAWPPEKEMKRLMKHVRSNYPGDDGSKVDIKPYLDDYKKGKWKPQGKW